MEKNKPWIIKAMFFLGTIVLGTEISRIYYRQSLLDLIESGSHLYQSGLIEKNDVIFDFNQLFTSYFPLIVFLLCIGFLSSYSKLNYLKKLMIIWVTVILSFILTFIISKEYFDLCKSSYFTQQIGLLISFSLAARFILKDKMIRKNVLYFFSALLVYSFFSKGLAPLIMKLKYGSLYFPFSKIDLTILSVCFISTSLYLFYQKKKNTTLQSA